MSVVIARVCFAVLLFAGLSAEGSDTLGWPKQPAHSRAKWMSMGGANTVTWGRGGFHDQDDKDDEGDTGDSDDGPVNTNDTGGGMHTPHPRQPH